MSLSDQLSGPGNNEFMIRRRNAQDAEALVRMFEQPKCREGMLSEPFQSVPELEAWLTSNGSDQFELVATLDGTAIALAGLYPCPGPQSHSAWICLFVHDAFHGRGLGTSMMMALVATAHLLRLTRIQLIVVADNERAISLYRRFGFEVEGRHEHYAFRGGKFLTVLTMSRITTEDMPRYAKMQELCRELQARVAAQAA